MSKGDRPDSLEQALASEDLSIAAGEASVERRRRAREQKQSEEAEKSRAEQVSISITMQQSHTELPQQTAVSKDDRPDSLEQALASEDLSFAAGEASIERRRRAREQKQREEDEKRRYELGNVSISTGSSSREKRKK